MWRFIQIVCVCFLLPLTTSKSISAEERSDNSDLSDDSQLMELFYNTIEEAVHHVVLSRDMHKLIREKRQLNNFGGGNFGQGNGVLDKVEMWLTRLTFQESIHGSILVSPTTISKGQIS